MWIKSYYRIPDAYRIPDRTKAKAELTELMADYKGTITLCPTGTADAPGVLAAARRGSETTAAPPEMKRQRRSRL